LGAGAGAEKENEKQKEKVVEEAANNEVDT
jgi:hypothetical protein